MIWKGIWADFSAGKQFFLLLLIACFSFMICYGVGVAYCYQTSNSFNDVMGISNLSCLKILQATSSLGIFVFPVLIFSFLTTFDLGLKPFKRQDVLLSVALIIFSMPLVNALVLWNESLYLPTFLHEVEHWMRAAEQKAKLITDAFLQMDNYSDLIINLGLMAILPAVGEELLFRGLLQQKLFSCFKNIHISIWITAFLFSALHLQFFGFFPRFLLGALLGYMFYWSGSLWLPIIAHFTNNALALLMSFFMSKNMISTDLDQIGIDENMWNTIAISGIAIVMMIYLFRPGSTRT